ELHAPLAALYVELAQQTDDPTAQAAYWGNAAELYEQKLGDHAQALEASLRRLAADLSNRAHLQAVDRLAVSTKAYRRLNAVYDRLLKEAHDDGEKVDLLRRHAALLERDHPSDALDRVLRACALAPQDEALLESAESLAERTQRSEELLVVYDRRRTRSDDDADRVQLLLRAARLCDGALRDRERANQYLKLAIAAAADSDSLAAQVEAVALELDGDRPELGADAARRELVRSERDVAERAEPAVAVRLLLRAADMMRHQLDDERSAFDLLRQGVALQPSSDEMFKALLDLAERLKRLDAVDAHLARLIDETIEPAASVVLLRRRGALLEGPLNRFQDAASVYTKLLQIRPDDAEASSKLLASLRRSGRHQDLLLVLNKQLQRTRDRAQRVELLRQIATTWERDIKNRWEALDAWKAVLREAGDDEVALTSIDRLGKSRATGEGFGTSAAPPAAESNVAAQAVGAAELPSAAESAVSHEPPRAESLAAEPERDSSPASPAHQRETTSEHEPGPFDEPDSLSLPAGDDSAQLENAATAEWVKPVIAAGNGIAAISPRPIAVAPVEELSSSEELAALGASLGERAPEEVDVLDAHAPVDVDVMFDDDAPVFPRPTVPRERRSSSVPPPPPTLGRVSLPPRLPGAGRSVPVPVPGAVRSAPPRPPARLGTSVPQARPEPPGPLPSVRGSAPPPPPPGLSSLPRPPVVRPAAPASSAARGVSKPPPLPSKRPEGSSQPPPPSRKES
ncbi:MAG TPA: hypothetical protein VK509_08405, partial [Polyangiales bacterium]|nr:hypothetical protein [Polyangiales bacterium]